MAAQIVRDVVQKIRAPPFIVSESLQARAPTPSKSHARPLSHLSHGANRRALKIPRPPVPSAAEIHLVVELVAPATIFFAQRLKSNLGDALVLMLPLFCEFPRLFLALQPRRLARAAAPAAHSASAPALQLLLPAWPPRPTPMAAPSATSPRIEAALRPLPVYPRWRPAATSRRLR